MRAIAIQNFRYGLDVRRLEETTQPGVVSSLVNGHINQGGEIEKRKTLEKKTLPANTFGAQVTATGIAVFGSADLSGETFPEPYYYVRCQTPDNATMISAIASSTNFAGEPIVICDFGASGIFTFRNGTIVDDLSPGRLALVYADAESLAAYFASIIGAALTDYTINASAGTLTIEGPTGQTFSVEASNESTCSSALPSTTTSVIDVTVTAMTLTLAKNVEGEGFAVDVYYDYGGAGQTTVNGVTPLPEYSNQPDVTHNLKSLADAIPLTMQGGPRVIRIAEVDGDWKNATITLDVTFTGGGGR